MSTDLFAVGCLVLYVATLALFAHYSRQNSQPARREVAELVESPAINAGWLRLAKDVTGPRPGEVRDVREG